MDDALRFREIMTAYGGKPGKPSRKLLKFLRDKGVSEPAVEYLTGYVLTKSAGVSAIDFYSQDGWLGANAEDFVPIAIRDGEILGMRGKSACLRMAAQRPCLQVFS